tara:strand:- start:970 stop:1227 length:258 start_codon:yes stop_codon:yes gene_type:complete
MFNNYKDQLAQTKPIYIYKENTALQNYWDIVNWHKDPGHIIEKLFFKNDYPCQSFVVISKSGKYISYFGEFPKEFVWEATERMNK